MKSSIAFASHISASQRGSLEALLYFNSCQNRVLDGIVEAVENFGPLEIYADGDRLRVRVDGRLEVQCLFAVEELSGRPVGIAVYARPDVHHLMVVHIGVAAEFAAGGKRAKEQLLLRLLREVRTCSRRIKGVQRFELFYLSGRGRSPLRQREMQSRAYA